MTEKTVDVHLREKAQKAIACLPHVFDGRLLKGLDYLTVNTPTDFLSSRPIHHLKKLLLTQFFLQKKMEATLQQDEINQKPLYLKLFPSTSSICVALIYHSVYSFQKEQLLKTLRSLLPGIQKLPRSFYLWQHPELPYIFCYLEIHKLRGEELSRAKLEEVEKGFRDQLLATPSLTAALFWPYNEEESFRQIQLLQREMHSKKDLPHISIHFQGQMQSSIEFLIHFARPQTDNSLQSILKLLPDSIEHFCHFRTQSSLPFPIELGAFSIKVPSSPFEVGNSINLLYARRYVLKHLEMILGSFRDYNGGLFEKQQFHFESLRIRLRTKIPHFDLFAEKLFYALHPVEKRFSLSLPEAEDLFSAFSELIQDETAFALKNIDKGRIIVKTADIAEVRKLCRNLTSNAQLNLGGYHYIYLSKTSEAEIQLLLNKQSSSAKESHSLKLIFQEGAPLSLNPYHSASDMRCRLLSKLLFEGLMRLNAEGKPELAGAREYTCSPDGLRYTFKIRPYRWSNGESVTAVDYATTMQCMLRDQISHPELLYVIKNANKYKEKNCDAHDLGINAIDAETLRIELEWPEPNFLHMLAQPYFFPLYGVMREPKWFNGPYIVRQETNLKIVLERNPYFWDSKRCEYAHIEILWNENIETIYQLFKKDKVDWIGDPLSSLSPTIIAALEREGKLCKQTVNRDFSVCYNTQHPILSCSHIRRALSLAIDRSLICKTIFPHCIPLPPLEIDVTEAQRLFDLGLQELGLTRETFPTLTFSFSHQTRRENLALCLQTHWNKVLGISIKLEKVQWNHFRKNLEKGFFEITGTIQETSYDESAAFLARAEGSSSWNFSQWTNSRYREIISRIKQEPDLQKRAAYISQAKEIFENESPSTPLFRYVHLFAHHPHIKDYLVDHEGCIDFC